MKSKTSYCNGTLMRRTIQRGLPLWGIYLLLLLVMLPGRILSWDSPEMIWLQESVLHSAAMCHLIAFFYGPAIALLVFSYLYKSTSANFFGALPIKRGGLFLTQYLSGLLMALVPNLLVTILSMAAGSIQGVNLVSQSLTFFGAHALTFLFYYSFACLVAMITGNLMAMPVLYGILNFAVVVVELLIRSLMETLLYGLTSRGEPVLLFLSPFANVVFGGHGPSVEAVFSTDANVHEIQGYVFHGWQSLLILAAVGVVFAVLAFVLYRSRRMESAGDVIAVRWLRPVALYCFTFGCALVLGMGIYLFLNYSENFVLMLVCMLVGGGVGYFLGEMLLNRSMRVFRKRNLANCAICAAVIVAGMLCLRLDLLGLTDYVPEREDVSAVSITYGGGWTEDPAFIDKTLELHQSVLENKKELRKARDMYYYTIDINYELTNGNRVTRCYNLPAYQNNGCAIDQVIDKYVALSNDPDYVVTRAFVTDYAVRDIQECHIYSYGKYGTGGDVYLTPSEAQEFLETALVPDLKESSMKKVAYNMETVEYQPGMPHGTGIAVDVIFRRKDIHRETTDDYYYFSIPSDAARVLEYAKAHGVQPTVDEPEG